MYKVTIFENELQKHGQHTIILVRLIVVKNSWDNASSIVFPDNTPYFGEFSI